VDNESNNLGDIFDKYLEFEFDKEDVDAAMRTTTCMCSIESIYRSKGYCKRIH